ncbi:MAG: UDP-N-acetylmuramoyl-tripeptide--D-alanyl-D-alanine ligase [Prolixibacteraceae bacterium]|nr:UDP-N-acetylmuramoyl-tripeptide--D-alanyl-D-alanine ligase [Prolixibacteraceae bacterium]
MTTLDKIYSVFSKNQLISTDSRNIEKNSIFFALKGSNFNGNKFASDALNKGAILAIVDEKEFQSSEKIILVDNVLETLTKLAKLHRDKLGIPILAITGTNGKTTTKELITAVLSKKFNVSSTSGNLNNHIGVPLTLLKMDAKTELGVVEMGANHPGEIAHLCAIADPDYGIITNIGKAHLEGFGSFEGVKKTKAELYDYLKIKKGTIFYHNEDTILADLVQHIEHKISYGISNADFTGEPIQSPPFVHAKVNFRKGILYLNSNLIGDFNFENVLAAACIGNYFGVEPLKIQQAIKDYYPKNNRSQLIQKNGHKIIMDAYNANPTSMQASIKSILSSISGSKTFILGDMLELGEYAESEHLKILEMLKDHQNIQVFLIGKIFSEIAINYHFQSFNNVEQLCDYLSARNILNENILIKGSRGIRLEKVLDYI